MKGPSSIPQVSKEVLQFPSSGRRVLIPPSWSSASASSSLHPANRLPPNNSLMNAHKFPELSLDAPSPFYSPPYQYICQTCGKGYRSKEGLTLHKQTHRGVRFNCPLCDMHFAQNSSMRRHLKDIHKSKQCNVCFSFVPVDDFNNHVLHCFDKLKK